MQIVQRTSVIATDSMLTMKAGETAKISCVDFAPLATVQSATTRLNQRAGWKEFEVTSEDNGATIVIKRNKK